MLPVAGQHRQVVPPDLPCLQFPPYVTPAAKDFVMRLLERKPTKRLGMLQVLVGAVRCAPDVPACVPGLAWGRLGGERVCLLMCGPAKWQGMFLETCVVEQGLCRAALYKFNTAACL